MMCVRGKGLLSVGQGGETCDLLRMTQDSFSFPGLDVIRHLKNVLLHFSCLEVVSLYLGTHSWLF